MQNYHQVSLFREDQSLLVSKVEDQWFDRKSARVSAQNIANLIVGFANADGGTIVIGVEDDGTVTGIGQYTEKQNEIRQAPLDYTQPPVRVAIELLECTNGLGQSDHVLVLEIPPSDHVHRNNRGEVFKRHGDQNRRLNGDAVRELQFDKGERYYDDTVVPNATLDSLDRSTLARFAQAVGTGDDFQRALRVRNLLNEQGPRRTLNVGAMLLFALDPEEFVPSAYVRILRYDGTVQLPGTRLNINFDRRIGGPLPVQIQTAETLMQALLREVTTLDEQSGRFVTTTDVPRFAWLEAIVNAVTHRSYSMQGDHIRVSIFDDRIEVQNPGQLPGPVRIDNIRETRFSRNPRIARALAELKIVQELNEGVPRIFDEMHRAGLPEPHFALTPSGFLVVLRRFNEDERGRLLRILEIVPNWMHLPIETLLAEKRITTGRAAELGGVTQPTARRYLQLLEEAGEIQRVSNSPRDPSAYWMFRTPFRGDWQLSTLNENLLES